MGNYAKIIIVLQRHVLFNYCISNVNFYKKKCKTAFQGLFYHRTKRKFVLLGSKQSQTFILIATHIMKPFSYHDKSMEAYIWHKGKTCKHNETYEWMEEVQTNINLYCFSFIFTKNNFPLLKWNL